MKWLRRYQPRHRKGPTYVWIGDLLKPTEGATP